MNTRSRMKLGLPASVLANIEDIKAGLGGHLATRLQAFDFSAVDEKFARLNRLDCSVEGARKECIRWLLVKSAVVNHGVHGAPQQVVALTLNQAHGRRAPGATTPTDAYWHLFILYSRKYHDFCALLGAGYLHHDPCNLEDVNFSAKAFENFRRLYQLLFNEEPSDLYFPSASSSGARTSTMHASAPSTTLATIGASAPTGTPCDGFALLPRELQVKVLGQMELEDLGRMAAVSKYWNALCMSHMGLDQFFVKKFRKTTIQRAAANSCKLERFEEVIDDAMDAQDDADENGCCPDLVFPCSRRFKGCGCEHCGLCGCYLTPRKFADQVLPDYGKCCEECVDICIYEEGDCG